MCQLAGHESQQLKDQVLQKVHATNDAHPKVSRNMCWASFVIGPLVFLEE